LMANMFKFLHAADIHLDSPLRGLETYDDAPVEQIRQATRRAFDRLISLALDEQVAFVLIAGDLYDGDWKDYNTGLFFCNRMSRLAAAGIDVFIVSGNHDAASQLTKALPLPKNVHLFSSKRPESKKIESLGVVIHGQSYATRVVADNIAKQYPPAEPGWLNIGLLHTALSGREGHEPYGPCTIDDLTAKGYAYWALGHIHKREEVCADPWIIFPGNIQGRHIKETGPKGATLALVDNGRVLKVEERSLDVLRWHSCQVDLSGCEAMDQVPQRVQAMLEELQTDHDGNLLAIRLILSGSTSLHGQLLDESGALTDYFRGLATGLGEIWLEKVLFQTSRIHSLDEILGDDTPIAELINSISRLEMDRADCLEIVPELAGFKSKLPPELLRNNDIFRSDSPEQSHDLYQEVKEILIAKLLKQGGGR